jgi:hypothetical protein
MNGPLIIQASVLHDFYVQVFLRTGVPEADAHLAAAVRLESGVCVAAEQLWKASHNLSCATGGPHSLY